MRVLTQKTPGPDGRMQSEGTGCSGYAEPLDLFGALLEEYCEHHTGAARGVETDLADGGFGPRSGPTCRCDAIAKRGPRHRREPISPRSS